MVDEELISIKQKNDELQRRYGQRNKEKIMDILDDAFSSKIIRLSTCINYLYEDIGR